MDKAPSSLPLVLQTLLPPSLHSLCTQATYANGARIFRSGAQPQSMFYVMQGEVRLIRHSEAGEAVVLQRAYDGFVAEASLTSTKYHCDAVAMGLVQLVKVPIRALRQALEKDATFALAWISMLNDQVRQLRLQCERLALRTVKQRLMHLISTQGQSGLLLHPMGLKPIAHQLGVSHEALYRCLAELEVSGTIARADGAIVILEA
jgi:CRP/FNR family transcriptional regulator, dissimilatory nitrate respiration regulator